VDDHLTLDGLRLIWERNREAGAPSKPAESAPRHAKK